MMTGSFLIAAVALLIMILAVGSNEASGKTITVDDNGEAEFESIQEAIDAAENGDTIRVWEGTYYENVVVDETVNLIGNGSEVTTIDGGENGDVVKITADWVSMNGFTVNGSGGFGIFLYYSDYNILTNNSCSNNKYGIHLDNSDHNILANNSCSLNRHSGIYLDWSDHNTLTNNTMNENGIRISGILEAWNTHIINTSNTVNGKPVRYYKNTTGITVPSDTGQVILANCTHMVVENQNCSDGSVGILVGYSLKTTISNNTCSNNSYGISLYRSDDCTLENNTCENNWGGISLSENSDHNTITNNTCSNNWHGIWLDWSDDCTITNNTCSSNNGNGIWLDQSDDCTITNNTCFNNQYIGISLYRSDDCTLENNTCNSNTYYGISAGSYNTLTNNTCSNNSYGISAGSYNTLTYNTISENGMGIILTDSSRDNTAHYNNIYNNTEYGINTTGSNGYLINATNNWWGDPSGPHHPTENPNGKGDNVTDYVEFAPWLEKKVTWQLFVYINSLSPNPASEGENIKFEGSCPPNVIIVRYVWRSSINGEFYNGTETEFYNNTLSLGKHIIYFKVQNESGQWSDEISTSLVVTKKPNAIIDSITPNPALDTEIIHFIGHGTDDGIIMNYSWQSNMDGEINDSESFSSSNLSIGNHTIYFKGQDDHGVWSDEVSTTLQVNNLILEKPKWETGDCWKWRYTWGTVGGLEDVMTITEKVKDSNSSYNSHDCFKLSVTYEVYGEKTKGTIWLSKEDFSLKGHDVTDMDPAGAFSFFPFLQFPVDLSEGSDYFWRPNQEIISVGEYNFSCYNFRGKSSDAEIFYSLDVKNIVSLYMISGDKNDEYIRMEMIEAFDTLPPNKIPTISITSPKDGDEVKDKITIKGSVSDEDGAVEKVKISINKEEWNTINLDGTTSWEFIWNTEDVDNGEYTIKVRSHDGTNYSEEVTITVTVDNTVGDDDDGGSFIPGFGVVAVVGAVGVAFILTLEKRKKED